MSNVNSFAVGLERIYDWKKVTKASELHAGQRVRYKNNDTNNRISADDSAEDCRLRYVVSIDGNVVDIINDKRTCEVCDIFNNKLFSEVEALFDIKGIWKGVLSPDELYIGQRIRYCSDNYKYGYSEPHYVESTDNGKVVVCSDDENCPLSSDVLRQFDHVEAFFTVIANNDKEKEDIKINKNDNSSIIVDINCYKCSKELDIFINKDKEFLFKCKECGKVFTMKDVEDMLIRKCNIMNLSSK